MTIISEIPSAPSDPDERKRVFRNLPLLGPALTRRRIELKFPHRAGFARGRPGHLSLAMVGHLERGDRPGYDVETIVAAEIMYRLREGTIWNFLATGGTQALEPADDPLRPLAELRETLNQVDPDELDARAAALEDQSIESARSATALRNTARVLRRAAG
jgi:hypothetical protein